MTTYNQAEPLVQLLGNRIGTRFVWGTGGDRGASLAGLASMFNNPRDFNILPYRHNHTQTGEYIESAFFIPSYSMYFPACDERGVCDEITAKQYYNSERVKKSNDANNLMEHKSEFCFYPEEALIMEGENRFDRDKLATQLANIEIHKTVELPKKINLRWKFDKSNGTFDINSLPDLEYSNNGKILIAEEPIKDENGIAYANLYVAGIDSIDADESSSTGQKDVSSFCITIKRRQLGLMEPKYVAIYKDRPRDVREAYDTAIKLLMWYNCKAVLESTRVSIVTYFKEKNKLQYLFKRPKATQSDISKGNSRMYGVPATVNVITHYLELIEMYISDYSHTFTFSEQLNELLKYSYENKRKFDIVAAMGMTELGDEELMGLTPRSAKKTSSEWKDIGYYTDEYGRKQFGVIPKYNENRPQLNSRQYDWIRREGI